MRPHYRLHFHSFDGRMPLWWVTWTQRVGSMSLDCTTGGFVDPALAIRAARIRSR